MPQPGLQAMPKLSPSNSSQTAEFSEQPHRLDKLRHSAHYISLIKKFSKIFKDQRAVPERFPTYFCLKKEADGEQFQNKQIVGLDEDLEIVLDCSADVRSFAVINDEEHAKSYRHCGRGHWCCVIGLAAVRVRGPIMLGDFIGVKGDGSGIGIVARNPYLSPIIGFSLESSEVAKCKTRDVYALVSQEPSFVRSMQSCSVFEVQQLWNVWKKLETAAQGLSSGYVSNLMPLAGRES
jgi:hypothetical protein